MQRQFIKKNTLFLGAFTIAKGTVFLAPLLAAEILSKEDFGILEYALAGLGMLFTTFINIGVPGAYPYFKLKQTAKDVTHGFALHQLYLVSLFTLNQLAFFAFGLPIEYYLAFNVGFVIANQVLISTRLKTHEKSAPAVLLDSGVYLTLAVFIGLAWLNVIPKTIAVINVLFQFYAVVYVLFAIFKFIKAEKDDILKQYLDILNFSRHLLVSTLLIFIITVSGRVLIEFFLGDFELVGIYGFYFRIAAIIVMIHQIINIAFFKKMYVLDPKILDKYFSIFFVALYIIGILAFMASFYIAPLISEFFTSTIDAYKGVYFILVIQMVFWIATALNSNIIDREGLASKNNPYFLGLAVIFITGLALFKHELTLLNFTIAHSCVILIAALIQYKTLYHKAIHFKKSASVLIGLFVISMLIYTFII